MSDPTGFVIDDELAVAPLRDLGWEVEHVPWDRPGVEWEHFEVVCIRSPWDYQARPRRFLEVLEEIERSGTRLENPVRTARWNLDKRYLRELAGRDVPVVPTVWRDGLQAEELEALFDEVGAEEIVLKPVVGANSDHVWRLDRGRARDLRDQLARVYAGRPLMAQPFVHRILTEGELSLFYFDGALSHAISKTPKAEDFRVQEEHGGVIRPIRPPVELRAAADRAMATLDETLLYARADFVSTPGGDGYWLMELELIEPALYFRMDPGAPGRFARALDRRCSTTRAKTWSEEKRK